MTVSYGGKPFDEALDYFRQKMPLPTNGWEDVYAEQHDQAFMVAGANKTAIVEDFATAIRAAMENGETLQNFRGRFDEIVKTRGWDYHGDRNWRSKLIYTTNIRQAYNAGREAQFADPEFQKTFPYIEYRHSGSEHPRLLHKSWDRLTLRAADPWWHTHSPSNGYGCNCKKFPKSERAMRRAGKTGPDTAPPINYYEHIDKRTGEVLKIPEGISPGFEYRPGTAQHSHFTPRYHHAPRQPIPMSRPDNLPLPPPTRVRTGLIMSDGLQDREYVQAFLNEFGITSGASTVFKDKLGEPLLISESMFRGASGALRMPDDKTYLPLLAQALIEPDEIWTLLEPDYAIPGKYRLARRYLKRWTIIESGHQINGISTFDYGQGIWSGRGFVDDRDLEKQREGVRVYRKEN